MTSFKKIGLAALFVVNVGVANAALMASGSVGGAPSGTNKWNMDDALPAGLTVTAVPGAGIVSGAVGGQFAAPFLSGGNGTGFGPAGGDQANGVDMTMYGTTGSTGAAAAAKFTLKFASLQQYFGLLWGSVDNYNTLSFFNGANNVGSLTGANVTASPNGNQGVNGTLYVNINSTLAFDTVEFTSSQFAFEFDNIAWSSNRQDVPEPGSLALLGLGLAGLAAASRRKQKQA